MQSMSTHTYVPAGSAPVIDVFGQRETFLWDDAASAVFFNDLPPGVGVPIHTHAEMDEAFLVVSGQIKLVVAGEELIASVGDYVHVPKGMPHGFVALEETRLLWCTPGGYRSCFEELAQVPMGSDGPDFGAMIAVSARYGTEIVGPPPQP